jgi:hypothetical protein
MKKEGQLIELKGSSRMNHAERVKMYMKKLDLEEEATKLKTDLRAV